MTNFASILDESPDEVKAPAALPIGTYIGVVQAPIRVDKSAKKGTEFTEFTIRLIEAGEDVDQEALAEIGGLEDRTVKATFYHTEDSIYRLDQFHQDCGIDLKIPASRRARNEECINCNVGVVISHESSQDGTRIYARVARTLPVE